MPGPRVGFVADDDERSPENSTDNRTDKTPADAKSDTKDDTTVSSGVNTLPAEPTDDVVSSKHQLRVGRRTLDYTATTGRVVLRDEVYEEGKFTGFKAKAEMSLTSYVVDPGDASRPVTFAFNGGPGSSSVWLHLGLFGPRRVLMGDAGALLPPPYELADNPESLLAVSDLVFIDPVSTGYSRTLEGTKAEPFHGYRGDIESVAELIRIWTSRNKRWMSPKVVAGESYGTLRGAALVEHLQSRHAMYVNGLVLISSVLDLSSIDFENQRNDRAHALYLPTYAAIAHYHGRLGRRSRNAVIAAAEEYATREYPWVLSRGDRLTARERAAAVKRLAALTGLSEDYVDRADLRIEHWRFFGELLRDQRRTVGRLDGRFTGPMASASPRRWTPTLARRDLGPVRRGVQPLRTRRAGLRERPALRADLPACAAVVLQGLRGPSDRRDPQARAGDAREPPSQGARRLRLLRRRDAVLRSRGRRRAPEPARRAACQHRAPLLRRRAHDVRPRAVPPAAEQGPGRLRPAVRLELTCAPRSPSSCCSPAR